MKTLVLGDVHGNLIALEKVLKGFKQEVDAIISHGDVVNYGPWSSECVALLESESVTCLLGNHEEAFLQGAYQGKHPLVHAFFKHTYASFRRFETIASYAKEIELEHFLVRHTINDAYYYPDSDLSELQLTKNTIIGHSHYMFHKTLSSGKTLTNTGSIGQNRKDLSVINFVIIEDDAIHLQSEQYDPTPVIREMASQKFPLPCINYYKSKLP